MKVKSVIVVFTWLCLAQALYCSGASKAADLWCTQQTTQPGSAKQYKLGETIPLRDGITLRILPGAPKSAELFASHQASVAGSYVIDIEFEIKPPAGGEAVAFELGENPGKSCVFLNAGEEVLMPKWFGWFPTPSFSAKPSASRIENGLHILGALPSDKSSASFLFELNGDQMKREKKLVLNFTMLPKERWSFVVDLN